MPITNANLAHQINQVPDQNTRNALWALFNVLKSDLTANKTAFANHTHKTPTTQPGITSTPTSDAGAAGSTGGTAHPGFSQNLG